MPWTLEAKIKVEHRFRELLRSEGMPQPDEVEYGHSCVRFLYHASKTCVVVDLDAGDGDNRGGSDLGPDSSASRLRGC